MGTLVSLYQVHSSSMKPLSVTTEEKPVSLALARLLELPGYLHHRTLPITSRVRKRLCDTLNKEAHSSLLLALATMSGYVVKVNN